MALNLVVQQAGSTGVPRSEKCVDWKEGRATNEDQADDEEGNGDCRPDLLPNEVLGFHFTFGQHSKRPIDEKVHSRHQQVKRFQKP